MPQRTTQRFVLAGLLLVSIALAACGGASPAARREAAPVAMEPGTDSTAVSVIAMDFSYTLDKPAASAGTINFVIENTGSMQHDFAIQANGVEQKSILLNSGQSTTLSVTLAPGTYIYRCTVPGHDVLGMKGIFTVN
jgi:uncharacterized cupredoxin-like copper-binding protein